MPKGRAAWCGRVGRSRRAPDSDLPGRGLGRCVVRRGGRPWRASRRYPGGTACDGGYRRTGRWRAVRGSLRPERLAVHRSLVGRFGRAQQLRRRHCGDHVLARQRDLPVHGGRLRPGPADPRGRTGGGGRGRSEHFGHVRTSGRELPGDLPRGRSPVERPVDRDARRHRADDGRGESAHLLPEQRQLPLHGRYHGQLHGQPVLRSIRRARPFARRFGRLPTGGRGASPARDRGLGGDRPGDPRRRGGRGRRPDRVLARPAPIEADRSGGRRPGGRESTPPEGRAA